MCSEIKDTRPSRDEVYIRMTEILSRRSTCVRRQTACIIVNARGHILSTGYNGVPSGWDHCRESPCPGALAESGNLLDQCQAIHAEQNALLQCPDVHQIKTVYSLTKPCIHCVKLILNTSCDRIVYRLDYPHSIESLWERDGRKLIRV